MLVYQRVPQIVEMPPLFLGGDIKLHTNVAGIFFEGFVGLSPLPVRVTTRIITFLVGNPYKPSFATVTGWGVDPRDLQFAMNNALCLGFKMKITSPVYSAVSTRISPYECTLRQTNIAIAGKWGPRIESVYHGYSINPPPTYPPPEIRV